MLDGDHAGRRASVVMAAALARGCDVRVAALAAGAQPDQLSESVIQEILAQEGGKSQGTRMQSNISVATDFNLAAEAAQRLWCEASSWRLNFQVVGSRLSAYPICSRHCWNRWAVVRR